MAQRIHLIGRERLELLGEADVVLQLTDGCAANGYAVYWQAQDIAQAFSYTEVLQEFGVGKAFHTLNAHATFGGQRQD